MTTRSARSSLASPAGALLALALATAACGASSATPSPSHDGDGGSTPPPVLVPTPVPGSTGDPGGASGGGGSDPGGGGGVAPGNPGGGVPVDPGPGGGDPANPEPTVVRPVAGVTGIRQVTVTDLDVAANGRDVSARVAWWSGVEPCYALAGVDVVVDGRIITLSVREGSAAGPDMACIEIAVYKATIVRLGELEPGTWTIRAAGDAAPVEITIAG